MEALAVYFAGTAALFGALVGSFLNVVILRLPKGKSIVFPGSHCPKCDYALKWYDNVPILSWLALRAKCRKCKEPISVQYPLVEAANALLWFLVVRQFDLSVAAGIYCLLCSALLTVTVIDLRLYIIPDEITLPGGGIGLLIAGAHSLLPIPGLRINGIIDALLGVAFGAGVLVVIGWLGGYYLRWRMKRFGQGAEPLPEHARMDDDDEEELELMAMGGGDVKLLAMLGTYLGWRGVYMTLLLGSVVGAVVGIVMLLVSRRGFGARLPFGPYLALGAALTLLAYDPILLLYQHLSIALAHALGIPVPGV